MRPRASANGLPERPAPPGGAEIRVRWAGLVAGPLLGLLTYLLLPGPAVDAAGEVVRGLTREGRATAGVGVLMAVWWLTEALMLATAVMSMWVSNTATVAMMLPIGTSVIHLVASRLGRASGPGDPAGPTAARLPWGILILFGGGLSLAAAIQANGVDRFIGGGFEALRGVDPFLIVLGVALVVIFLTELTSNTAVTNTLMPVLGGAGAATALGLDAALLLIPAALAASYAFMLPVATPPNAIVFGSGYVGLPQMVKAGFWLNLMGAVVVAAMGYFFAGALLSLDLGGGAGPG